MKNLKGLLMILCCVISSPVVLAPMQAKAEEQKTYTVTFRPGKVAEFKDSYYESAVETYGSVTKSEHTGSIKIQVPAGAAMPNAPTASDIQFKEEYAGRYVMNTEWFPQAAVVTESCDFVVDYDAAGAAIEYNIHYVDAQSGEDVKNPVIATGNEGQTITVRDAVITGYRCNNQQTQTLKLAKGETNSIVYEYTSTTQAQTEVVEVPGDVITNVREVAVAGGTTTGNTQAAGNGTQTEATETDQTADSEETAESTETESSSETESAGTESPVTEEPESQQLEDLEDDQVPLGNQDLKNRSSEKKSNSLALGLGIAAGAILLGLGAFFIVKKRRQV